MIYQLFEEKTSSTLAILTFLPQWGLVILAGLFLYHDLFLALFVQTTAFVMFNKVITAQYFLWYVALLPFVLVGNRLTKEYLARGIILSVLFAVFDFYWLRQSFLFEFAGQHTFSWIQFANFLWFWYTCLSLQQIIAHSSMTVTRCISPREDEGTPEIREKKDK